VSKSTLRTDRFILARIGVLTVAKKPASKLTDKELVRRLFPKDVRNQLKEVLAELNAEKPAKKHKKR
jgi:hypothetical protein